nr:hypothetical protein [Halomonas niordiana]
MTLAHILGYPRIGADRELKKATEAYWNNAIDQAALEAVLPVYAQVLLCHRHG